MRRGLIVLALSLLLACNLPRVAATVAPTAVESIKQATVEPPPWAQPPEPTAVIPTTVIPAAAAEVVSIPSTSIQIAGLPYTAYRLPGDPFQFVCQEPCPLDPQYVYAEYAGFRLGYAELIRLTGIDTLPELQPVDMHLVLDDSVCGELPAGHAGVDYGRNVAYTCSDGPGYYPTQEEKIRMAARADGQYFPLHEYMHTFFFGRLSGNAGAFQDYKATFLHDFVVPVPSYAVGIIDRARFCSYHDGPPPGDYNGWLIFELCRQNGFQLKDLALSLNELDALYQSGGGQVEQPGFKHPAATIAQYRDILNRLLNSDTTPAFAAACWPAGLFGNNYSLGAACAAVSGTPTPLK